LHYCILFDDAHYIHSFYRGWRGDSGYPAVGRAAIAAPKLLPSRMAQHGQRRPNAPCAPDLSMRALI
jgi:hypothetical protein